MVSHDRAFLERTVTDVIIVDGNAGATRRPGGLSRWLADRAAAAVPGFAPPTGRFGASGKTATGRSAASGKTATGKPAPPKRAPGGKPSASTLRHRLRDTETELAT